jgi:OOP family OmpA-OmpF porin
MIRACTVIALSLVVTPLPVAAVELAMTSGTRLVSNRTSPLDSYRLPTGSFADDMVPNQLWEGRVERQSWRIDSSAITTLQLLDPLREQATKAGFRIIFECEAQACGGFDFRFATEVIPAPDMHVDIRDYRFVSAVSDDNKALSLLVSRSRTAGYIQVIHVDPERKRGLEIASGTNVPAPSEPDAKPESVASPTPDFGERLMAQGHLVLSDLDFVTGADSLSSGSYQSLQDLAAFLRARPRIVVGLVGHTDSVGELESNIKLSKRRAEAVRDRLIATYGIDPTRVQAEGMGFLAPIASNLTQPGREANRRVEAILLFSK